MINQVMETVKETINTETILTNQLGTLEANNDILHSLILPYAEHDLIYYSKYLEPNCDKDYLGETGRRRIERTADHYGKGKQSHLLKHALISNHTVADLKDFKIIDKNYHGNKYKRKISEALHIKQYRPLLNAQEHSVQLKLFN